MWSVRFRSRHFAFRGATLSLLTAPRLRVLSIAAAIPQDVESSSPKSHRTKKMRMHFMRSLRAFHSNKQRLLKFLITLNKKDLNVPILNLSMKKSPHKEGFNY
ncbi:hypothetical protein CYJ37_05875 [Bacillus sp. UMB0728]|uniref:Uncharacterized protein n=1 Tax=Bacillus infantis NRRL B-14911 TaxID=1367477 RepID=U5LHN9_9BACI|nr:hypothetical protein N288_25895 [Bacillus infantis NRRL B-14911]PLR73088.1 hypothetical protein CYJ37_05875 [Bacillus sp. UMB0728]